MSFTLRVGVGMGPDHLPARSHLQNQRNLVSKRTPKERYTRILEGAETEAEILGNTIPESGIELLLSQCAGHSGRANTYTAATHGQAAADFV